MSDPSVSPCLCVEEMRARYQSQNSLNDTDTAKSFERDADVSFQLYTEDSFHRQRSADMSCQSSADVCFQLCSADSFNCQDLPIISFSVMLLNPQIPDEVEGIETDRSHRSFDEDSVVDELDAVQRSRAESRSPESTFQPVNVHASSDQPTMYAFTLLLLMMSSI